MMHGTGRMEQRTLFRGMVAAAGAWMVAALLLCTAVPALGEMTRGDAGKKYPAEALEAGKSGFLRQGHEGELVMALQRGLGAIGFYSGPVTGYFGPLTREAVVRFQRARRLTPDGVVSPETWKALSETDAPRAAMSGTPRKEAAGYWRRGNKGEVVREIQQQLQVLGYFKGPVTGYFGPLTRAAVMAFQKARDLPADGVADPRTRKAIDEYSYPAEVHRDAPAPAGETNRSSGLIPPAPPRMVLAAGSHCSDAAAGGAGPIYSASANLFEDRII